MKKRLQEMKEQTSERKVTTEFYTLMIDKAEYTGPNQTSLMRLQPLPNPIKEQTSTGLTSALSIPGGVSSSESDDVGFSEFLHHLP